MGKLIDEIKEPELFIGQIEESKYKSIIDFLKRFHGFKYTCHESPRGGGKCMFKYFLVKYFI